MMYRKFRADQLFNGKQLLSNEQVLICKEDGSIEAIVPLSDAGDDIQQFSGILSPGFINAHCHLELSHLQGQIPERTGMVDFLLSVMGKRNFSKEDILVAIDEAETQMLNNGIVAVGDICNTIDTIEQKNKARLYYHNFIEATGFVDANAGQRFQLATTIFEQFARCYTIPVESNSIVPHAPYSVSSSLFKAIADFPGNQLLSIHNQEHEAENELYKNKTGDFLRLFETIGLNIDHFNASGKTSLQSFLPYFYSQQQLLLVHNVATKEDDLEAIRSSPFAIQNLYFCLCPNANLYINETLPDVNMLIRHECNIVVGTDSLASNHSLDILSELRLLHEHFPSVDMPTLLQWATINGAKALKLDGILGSFENGKQPGIIHISADLQNVKRLL
jgi:cytosine/adenosine deaminase-related metal-dependent hydrolase